MLYAYVDESQRSGRYLLCAVVVDAGSVGLLRRRVRKLLLPGQRRLHFNNEGNRRRRSIASAIVTLDVDVDDRPVIDAVRAGDPPLTYEHVDGVHEPLLWLPDAYAWLVGAGGDWRRRVLPAIDQIVDIR